MGKASYRPVVTAPQALEDGTAVVVAYDGSIQAARVLQAFQASGLDEGDAVHVVGIGANPKEAARPAARAVEFLCCHEIAASAHVFAPSPSAAAVILGQVRYHQARLLVMGADGRSRLRELFLGSVPCTLLQHSQVPLFLYH